MVSHEVRVRTARVRRELDSLLEQDLAIGLHVRCVLGGKWMMRHVAPANGPVAVLEPILFRPSRARGTGRVQLWISTHIRRGYIF